MTDVTIKELEALLSPAVEALGYVWWGCVIQRHSGNTLLRIYIDKSIGIDVEDCAKASHQVSGVLAVHDPISGEYTLEVSSPGLDRPLFSLLQYEQFIGQKIKLRLKVPKEGQRNFLGVIEKVEKNEITIEGKIFQFNEIERANIVPDFADLGVKGNE
jgi:ribosome maturation factor RimP